MKNLWRAIRFELAKVSRMRLARALLLILVAETCAKATVFHLKADEMVGMMARDASTDSAGYLASLMFTSLNAVNLVALVFASLLIAGEASSGALRLTASLPMRRSTIIGAKIVALALFVVACVAIVGVVNLAATYSLYGIEAVRETDYIVYTAGQFVRAYFLMHALAVLPILAIACFGLLVSAWSSSSGGAVGVTILLYFGLSTYEQLKAPWLKLLQMRRSLLEAFVAMANGFNVQLGQEIGPSLAYAAGYFALFAGLTVATFALRDNYT